MTGRTASSWSDAIGNNRFVLLLGCAAAIFLLATAYLLSGPSTKFVILDEISDCESCPEMIVFGPGMFRMGQDAEHDRDGPPYRRRPDYFRSEPVFWAEIVKPFAVAKFNITRGEFKRFVDQSGYRPASNCSGGHSMSWRYGGKWDRASYLGWLMSEHGVKLDPPPGRMNFLRNDLEQDDTHPATCISRPDIVAYVDWFNETQKPADLPPYRLMEPIEYEYVARGHSISNRFTWGNSWADSCAYANVGDEAKAERITRAYDPPIPCNDGYVFTAPVGSFPPVNGLYDINGNVTEALGGFATRGNSPERKHLDMPDRERCASQRNCDPTRVPAAGGAWYKSEMKNEIAHYSHNRILNNNGNREALTFIGFRLARTCRDSGPC